MAASTPKPGATLCETTMSPEDTWFGYEITCPTRDREQKQKLRKEIQEVLEGNGYTVDEIPLF